MKRFVVLACVLALSSTLSITLPARPDTIPGGRFGEVRLSTPQGPMRGFMVLFSRLGGWTTADLQTADALAAHDILVVGVDSGRYLTTLAATPETCHRLFNDVTAISGQLQREQSAGAYFTPVVAGIGDSGLIAEQVLSGAPSNTIAGAISIDPTANVDARVKSCPLDPSITHVAGLPGFWSIGATADLNGLIDMTVTDLRKAGAHIDIQHFGSDTRESAMLLALSEPHLGVRQPDATDVASLPLIELPAQHPSSMLAIVVSGDGGWHDLDQTIAHHLQSWGVSVVGIDSLRFFWSKKSPEETARTFDNVIRTYATRWHSSSVALIGYSFGADVLPFVYNRMSARERDKVKLMALLGLAKAADFEIKITGWLGLPPSAAALPEQPEISKIPLDLVQCFVGDDETDSMCPALAKLNLSVIRTPGGHHFGGDYLHLAQLILDGWRRRMTGG
jgi:type IV secretory pathway VirJ component